MEKMFFPTRYRANSVKDIRLLADAAGLEVASVDHIESRPEYLRMNALTYIPGIVYERLVNKLSFLSRFRILLIVELRKPKS